MGTRLRIEGAEGIEWGQYTRLVGDHVDAGVRELGLAFSGEPFATEWLPEAIAFAKGRGIAFAFVTTHGVLATPELLLRCFEAGLDQLEFAIDPTNPEALFHLGEARRIRDAGGFECRILP